MITHHTVMSDMHVGHEKIVATDARNAVALNRAPIDRAIFANDIAVTDLQARRRPAVTKVLGGVTDRAELIDLIVLSNRGWPVYHDMGTNPRAVPDFNVLTDNRIGADVYFLS
jgi:hypothetical protein